MAFKLGNFSIDEIILAVAESNDKVLYTLDQLSTASIEVTSESTDITDKNGNVVRTIYKSKQGTFNATNAFLHPQIAASGSDIKRATSSEKIVMPKVVMYAAEATATVKDLKALGAVDDGSGNYIAPEVIGIFGAGANSNALTASTTAAFSDMDGTFKWDATTGELTLPAAATDAPVSYMVKFDRTVEDGITFSNYAKEFPKTVEMTLYCSYVDPCDETLKACYVYLPSFQPSPETTLSLSADSQEMDFNGNINISYCDANPVLYTVYFPSENAVKTAQ